MEWQPIDTAPLDGTEVIITGFIENNEKKGRWVDIASFNSFGVWGGNIMDDIGFYPPTHWMPLPSPPQAKEE